MLTEDFEARYQQLVQAWLTHDELRRQGAPVRSLAASGGRLGGLRVAVARERRRIVAA